jgi:hypothetical protein
MWFPRVKQLFHPFVYGVRHNIKTGMLNPMHSGIFSERVLLQSISGDILIQVQ